MAERIATMELSRFWKVRNAAFALRKRLGLSPVGAMPPFELDASERSVVAAGGAYGRWLAQHAIRASDVERMREAAALLPVRPIVSLVLREAGEDAAALRTTLASVVAQAYDGWELCLPSGPLAEPEAERVLGEAAAADARIRRGLDPIALAGGDFLAFLDPGDALGADAAYELAVAVNRFPDVDFVYADEDELDTGGVLGNPHFKPDWAPDSLLSRAYTGRFAAYRRTLVAELGGVRAALGNSAEYDLALRVGERAARIHHVPRVLYHRRAGAAPYAGSFAERAVADALERRGEPGRVVPVPHAPGVLRVRYAIASPAKVSIVVPTRDHADDVARCLGSLFALTTFSDFEVLLVDNGSAEREALAAFADWETRDARVRVLRHDVPFNYAEINNWAVAQARGAYVVLLNNDTEIVTPDWLEALVEQAQRPAVGAVGALLLYDDDTVQHAGVILGINGVAGHSHKNFPRDAPGYDGMLAAVNNYSAVTAACLMVRKTVYDELGGLDEELAVAFNDVDFCLRAGAAGYRNVWLPHVILRHAESKSRGRDTTFGRRRVLYREEAFMKRRWATDVRPDPYYNPNLTRRAEDFSIRVE